MGFSTALPAQRYPAGDFGEMEDGRIISGRGRHSAEALLQREDGLAQAGIRLHLGAHAAVGERVSVPVIASGGAGGIQDFVTLFTALPKVDAGLAASIFHFGEVQIPGLKQALQEAGIPMRRV